MAVLFSSCIVKKSSECFLPLWNVMCSTWKKTPVTSYLFIYFTNLKSGPRLICNLLVLAIFGGEASAAPHEAVKISRKFLQIQQAH